MSKLPPGRGAVLVLGGGLVAIGSNRLIIPEGRWEVSAVQDAMFRASRGVAVDGATMFLSCFPSAEDVKLMAAVGVGRVYFFGLTNDGEAADMLNGLEEGGSGIEMIQLE